MEKWSQADRWLCGLCRRRDQLSFILYYLLWKLKLTFEEQGVLGVVNDWMYEKKNTTERMELNKYVINVLKKALNNVLYFILYTLWQQQHNEAQVEFRKNF